MKLFVIASGSVLVGGILLALLNVSASLPREEAEERIRLLMSREITQRYLAERNGKPAAEADVGVGLRLKEALEQLNGLEFLSVDVKRPIPDILLRPHQPGHVVRVVLRDRNRQYAPRYFWLPWGDVDSETSRWAWFFSM